MLIINMFAGVRGVRFGREQNTQRLITQAVKADVYQL